VAVQAPPGPFHDKANGIEHLSILKRSTERRTGERHLGITLSQAAKLVSVSKATISRAVRDGRLRAARRADGTLDIELSDLEKIYPLVPHRETVTEAGLRREFDVLRELVTELRQRLDVADAERAALRQQVDQLTLRLLGPPKTEG
jgi:excisionase family DNA binding protein